jgi:hypothetical protein
MAGWEDAGMSDLADQQAFPGISDSEAGCDPYNNQFTRFCGNAGMTLRQYYAGEAMQGILSCGYTMKAIDSMKIQAADVPPLVAGLAAVYANALLTALSKPQP